MHTYVEHRRNVQCATNSLTVNPLGWVDVMYGKLFPENIRLAYK
jgi:hypothetical protein